MSKDDATAKCLFMFKKKKITCSDKKVSIEISHLISS